MDINKLIENLSIPCLDDDNENILKKIINTKKNKTSILYMLSNIRNNTIVYKEYEALISLVDKNRYIEPEINSSLGLHNIVVNNKDKIVTFILPRSTDTLDSIVVKNDNEIKSINIYSGNMLLYNLNDIKYKNYIYTEKYLENTEKKK